MFLSLLMTCTTLSTVHGAWEWTSFHPLIEEAWGVTRFFYWAADGRVVNVGMHTK